MNKVVRCCAAVIVFLFLLTATILVLPIVVDVQRFKPEIENKLSDITGRSISIGSNLGVSFVPALSISFSDFTMGNPEGYLSNYFFKIDSFEARIKILPLLKKNVEFSRFIVSGLEVNLEKNRDGRKNWNFAQEQSDENKSSIFNVDERGWSLSRRMSVELFAVTDGKATLIDRIQNSHFMIDDLMLLLHNFSLNNSVEGEVKASINGKSFTAEGKVGAYIVNNEHVKVPFDLLVSLFDAFKGQVKGGIVNLPENQLYAFEIKVNPSSAKDLFASLDTGSLKKLRAEFSELQDVFTLRNDLIDNTDTMLKMPFANILISGTAEHFRNQAQLLTESQVLPGAAKEQKGRDIMGSGTPDAPGRLSESKINIDAQYHFFDELSSQENSEHDGIADKNHSSTTSEREAGMDVAISGDNKDEDNVKKGPENVHLNSVKKQKGSGRILISPLQERQHGAETFLN